MNKHALNDIIIVVPGILGSVLQRNGKDVWAPTPGAVLDAARTLARNIKELAIGDDPVEADELGDGVIATRLVPDVHFIPGFTAIDGYTGMRGFLFSHFDLAEGQNYFEFPYDWRRDNRVAARKLKRFAERALAQARLTTPSARLILIAHSMGGLVSQYYLECLDGAKDARILITLGTPFRGSVKALDFIAHGLGKSIGPLKLPDPSDLLRSMTSVYQLLPRYPCVHFEGKIVRPAEAEGIPNLDRVRARRALEDFHFPIEEASKRREGTGCSIYPVVGIGQETRGSANMFAAGQLALLQGRTAANGDFMAEAGDGTVPRVAALPIGFRQDSGACHYTYARHSGLQNSPGVQAQILGLLTEIPDLDKVRDVRCGLALELDEVFGADEPILARVTASQPRHQLVASVTDTASGTAIVSDHPLEPDGRSHTLRMAPLPAGCYRLQVRGQGHSCNLVEPITELFVVAAEHAAAA